MYSFYFTNCFKQKSLIQPASSFSILPLASSVFSLSISVNAKPMLFSFEPLTVVFAAILPLEFSVAVAFVLSELSDILFAIRPNKVAVPMHFIVQPFTLVLFTIAPNVGTSSADLIHLKVSIVD